MSATIDVRELRVGMFVHLDTGWMSHPFPRSSFKITSADQIATIRELGLGRVRWSPDKSDDSPEAAMADAPVTIPRPAVNPEAEARRQAQRAALAAERAALARCERQYADAAQAWRELSESVADQPGSARDKAEALTRALLDQMVGEQELCIRLLTEGAGERATAHALNVTIVSLLMGRVFGLGDAEMMELGMGAMLHDIGKLDLPDRVHHADDSFSMAELHAYRDHVQLGVRQGRRMGVHPGVLLVIAQHHEQADGLGFPQGLALEKMSGPARIVSLVNRYDKLCNPFQAGKALTPHEALSLLFAQGKNKFDATMLSGFIRMMGVYPPGSVVQLTDDRYAMVVACNSSRPLRPRVVVHDHAVPREEALLLDLEGSSDIGIRRSLKPSQLPAAALQYLSPGRRVAYFFEPVIPAESAPVPDPSMEQRA